MLKAAIVSLVVGTAQSVVLELKRDGYYKDDDTSLEGAAVTLHPVMLKNMHQLDLTADEYSHTDFGDGDCTSAEEECENAKKRVAEERNIEASDVECQCTSSEAWVQTPDFPSVTSTVENDQVEFDVQPQTAFYVTLNASTVETTPDEKCKFDFSLDGWHDGSKELPKTLPVTVYQTQLCDVEVSVETDDSLKKEGIRLSLIPLVVKNATVFYFGKDDVAPETYFPDGEKEANDGGVFYLSKAKMPLVEIKGDDLEADRFMMRSEFESCDDENVQQELEEFRSKNDNIVVDCVEHEILMPEPGITTGMIEGTTEKSGKATITAYKEHADSFMIVVDPTSLKLTPEMKEDCRVNLLRVTAFEDVADKQVSLDLKPSLLDEDDCVDFEEFEEDMEEEEEDEDEDENEEENEDDDEDENKNEDEDEDEDEDKEDDEEDKEEEEENEDGPVEVKEVDEDDENEEKDDITQNAEEEEEEDDEADDDKNIEEEDEDKDEKEGEQDDEEKESELERKTEKEEEQHDHSTHHHPDEEEEEEEEEEMDEKDEEMDEEKEGEEEDEEEEEEGEDKITAVDPVDRMAAAAADNLDKKTSSKKKTTTSSKKKSKSDSKKDSTKNEKDRARETESETDNKNTKTKTKTKTSQADQKKSAAREKMSEVGKKITNATDSMAKSLGNMTQSAVENGAVDFGGVTVISSLCVVVVATLLQ